MGRREHGAFRATKRRRVRTPAKEGNEEAISASSNVQVVNRRTFSSGKGEKALSNGTKQHHGITHQRMVKAARRARLSHRTPAGQGALDERPKGLPPVFGGHCACGRNYTAEGPADHEARENLRLALIRALERHEKLCLQAFSRPTALSFRPFTGLAV